MVDPALQAQIDAARVYDDFFVPALFREWPARVMAAAGICAGERVLDIACGTGVLTREIAARVGPDGRVAGVDINPGMLNVARRLAPKIEYREGCAESLPFGDASFDVVTCQFGLMFFADRDQALREMARVLKPGGRMAAAVWDSLDNTPVYAAEVSLLRQLAGERAAEALRAPFVLGDRRELASLVEAAGFILVHVQTHTGKARFPDIRSIVEADLRGWLPIWGVELTEERIQQILADAEQALKPHVTQDGGIAFDSPAHIVTGRKP